MIKNNIPESLKQELDPRIFRNLIRPVLTNLGAQLAIYQMDCTLLWANDNYIEEFGVYPDEIERTCLDHFHNDDERCPGYLIRKTCDTHTIQNSVFKIQDKNGDIKYFNAFTFPVYDDKRNFSNIIEISWDISKDVAFDSVSGEQNALLRNLADTSLDAILVINENDLITFWNKGAEKLLGYRFDEVIHNNFRMIFPEQEHTKQELHLMRQLLNVQGYLKNFETELRKKDGQFVKVEITRAFVNPELKERMGSYLILRDISARKNLEYMFRKTIEKLAKLHEISDLLHRSTSEEEIYRVMLISVTAGEGLKFNRAFLLMTNYDNQILEGKLAVGPANLEEAGKIWEQIPQQFNSLEEILDSFRDRDVQKHEKVMESVNTLTTPLKDESSIMVQAIKNRKSYLVRGGKCDIDFDPRICYILNNDTFAVIPIITKETAIGILIVDNVYNREQITLEDIDALEIFATQAGLALENAQLQANLSARFKELEIAYNTLQDSQDKLVRSERLATIGEVVAKISHEIRNPLVCIGGFSGRLMKSSEPESNAYHYLDIISTESKRLEKILDDILNYSTMFQPKKEPCNLGELLQKNLLIVMDDLQKQSILLKLELDEANRILLVDPNQMTQVFLNIIRNCIQAMPKGGKLTLKCRKNMDFIVVEIKDTGIGIKKKDLDQLFQPFYTTKSRGLGLGLSISQQIMTNHGGRIEVKSRYQRGTTFSIFLPAI